MGFPRAGISQQETTFASGPQHDEPDLARLTARVMTLVGRGELATFDAELEAATRTPAVDAGRPGHWRVPLWSGMRALLAGRLEACDRLTAEAARAARAEGDSEAGDHVDVLLVALRRDQDRPAEAEVILRDLLGRRPSLLAARVAWASLLGAVGRDSLARAELRRFAADDFAEVRDDPGWLAAMCQLAELAVVVDRPSEAGVLYRHLEPFAWRFAVEPLAAACYGSVARYLGLLAHALGRWDDGQRHFEDALAAHRATGAPVLAAHTLRQYAALLRVRGHEDDWGRAVELLSEAENIYRRLGLDGRATEAQAVLSRSRGHAYAATDAENTWRRDGSVWWVRYGGRPATLQDSPGVRNLAVLVASPGQSFHVAHLWAGTGRGVSVRSVPPEQPGLDDHTRADCRSRLEELELELEHARRRDDHLAMSVVRAEQEVIAADLAGGEGQDPVAQVRRLVTLRIRRELDRVHQAHPELGRHLRDSVRMGTFCAYEPPGGATWST